LIIRSSIWVSLTVLLICILIAEDHVSFGNDRLAVLLTVIPPAAFGLKTTVNIAMRVTKQSVRTTLHGSWIGSERTIWRLCVQSNSNSLELCFQELPLLVRFRCIHCSENIDESSMIHSYAGNCDSLMMIMTSAVLATLTTCRPRPRPIAAPSTIPGKSRSCIRAPSYSSTPGIAYTEISANTYHPNSMGVTYC
jgi:hypothetical protein